MGVTDSERKVSRPVGSDDSDRALDDMASALFALAHPARIGILRQVRTARGLSQIQVNRPDGDGRNKALSRQAVREHVERLVEAGLIAPVSSDGDARRRVRYVLNQQRLYALAERMRELSRLSGDGGADDATLTVRQRTNAYDLAPQSLVMVKGPDEGRVFPLPPPPQGTRRWVVGRQRAADVALVHDAYVSSENAVVTWDDGSYFIEDAPQSRNGTQLNFQAMQDGRRERLRNGDLVGVGHTILMFRS